MTKRKDETGTGPEALRVLSKHVESPAQLLALAHQWEQERDILRALNDAVPQIDNGYCAVCRLVGDFGYRVWSTDGKRPGPCSNERCLSHRISEVLLSS